MPGERKGEGDMTKQCLSARNLTQCGNHANFLQEGRGGLVLEDIRRAGIFVSRTYDSGQAGTEWNLLMLDVGPNVMPRAYVYLFDDYGEAREVDGQADAGKQLDMIKSRAQYTSSYREMLLYGEVSGKGRYARVAVEILAEVKQEGMSEGPVMPRKPVFGGYALSFPKEGFARYLPAVYGGNIQLDRFLAVQQSLYLELEQRIDGIAGELDYEFCGREQAARLAGWLGWGSLAKTAEEDIVKELLGTGLSLLCRKGTKEYYEKLAEILTGREARVMEDGEPGGCSLLIKGRPPKGRERYLEWIRDNVPLGVKMEIVILHRTARLDGSFFLDHTSCLAECESELTEGGISADDMLLL